MQDTKHYDIIILGGGIAGSIMAISLKRKNPLLSVLIIERSVQFPNKVGESSAEITGLFFNRFKINKILKKQVPKAGLRFLFNENSDFDPNKISEFSSPSLKSLTNGYHFNRQQFDEDMLAEATELGCVLIRPAEVVEFRYEKLNSLINVRHNQIETEYRGTWIIDASGTERIVGKQLNWTNKKLSFNTSASLAHFKNLRPLSEWDALKSETWDKKAIGKPQQSTIHFLRHGCWWWHIVLNNETTSIGVVYDTHILNPDDRDRFFNEYIENDPQLNFVTKGAERGPIRHLYNLPYISERLYSDGVAVIGDAAAFIDPLFSPGIEFICQQSIYLTEVLIDYFEVKEVNDKKWNQYESLFLNAFTDRLSVYENRYKVMHSYDVFSNWVQLDFFGYFGFTVFPSIVFPSRMKIPPRFTFPSNYIYKFITNRYLKIASNRKKQGRVSSSLNKPVSYSQVSIPAGIRFYFKVPQLFFVWLINYLKIEKDEFKYKVFKK